MMQLHEDLRTTENKISFSRQYYNDEVNRLNTAVQSFPDNIVANGFNFKKEEFFEIEDTAQKKAPKVKF
jgi:LemA protein